ncbi:phosphate ABC transporter membrane protein 1 (PhoT family) [Plasticicumulans lactativorans]|uniref:Phosphate transport system permease protein n=1 Tax=Plasticicumulans lactativorans TaxID=1133106 RepID=A0A4V2SDN0_9GAMM|nr:phosphate ABC transporter permease subunit PstC [Plasticicumulans lactativorans]TCO83705.1 phosphate ABC transporter membrane protein 1 (PhoT family) [Plasticicumulans lactativorans]
MTPTPAFILTVLLGLSALAYHVGRRRALAVVSGKVRDLHSLPSYYGAHAALWCALPALAVFLLWNIFEGTLITHVVLGGLPDAYQQKSPAELNLVINDIRNTVRGIVAGTPDPVITAAAERYRQWQSLGSFALVAVVAGLGGAGIGYAWRQIVPQFRARNRVERAMSAFLVTCSTVAIFTTIGIVLSVAFESMLFFTKVPVTDFLFGLDWSPQTAIRADQTGASGSFGMIPLFVGTLLVSLIAMIVAVPLGLLSALYLAEYAPPAVRTYGKPLLEVLAGIPTVVYGFFAALTVAPLIRSAGTALGLEVASESALAAGAVMGIMIIPFVSSLSDDVINAVPQAMRDGSYALGATKSETIKQVILPAALPGIVGSVLLAVSRAIGETMIVVMAAGLSANLTLNPLDSVTTVTVQIVTLLVGDQEFDSPKTLAAFALGLVLFTVTLALNIIALRVVRKYREQYE